MALWACEVGLTTELLLGQSGVIHPHLAAQSRESIFLASGGVRRIDGFDLTPESLAPRIAVALEQLERVRLLLLKIIGSCLHVFLPGARNWVVPTE